MTRLVLLRACRWCRQKLDLLDSRLQGREGVRPEAEVGRHHAIPRNGLSRNGHVTQGYQGQVGDPVVDAEIGNVVEENVGRVRAGDRGNIIIESRNYFDLNARNVASHFDIPLGKQMSQEPVFTGPMYQGTPDGPMYRSDDGGQTWVPQPEAA